MCVCVIWYFWYHFSALYCHCIISVHPYMNCCLVAVLCCLYDACCGVVQCSGARVSSMCHCRRVSAVSRKQLREHWPALVLLVTSSDRVVHVGEICLPSLSLSTAWRWLTTCCRRWTSFFLMCVSFACVIIAWCNCWQIVKRSDTDIKRHSVVTPVDCADQWLSTTTFCHWQLGYKPWQWKHSQNNK